MNKRIAALLTAVSVLAGVCAPVCADSDEALPTEIVITLSDADSTDAAKAPEEAESEDIASDAETEEADTSAEPEDSAADTDEEDTDAAEETPVAADTAVEADIDDMADSNIEINTENNLVEVIRKDEDGNFLCVDYEPETVSDDEYITDEAAYMAASWADWDASTGTLTLKGQLCNTYWDGTFHNIAQLSGIESAKVRKVVVTKGTLAGTSMSQMFREMENLTEIQGLSNIDTSLVTETTGMFVGCQKLKKADLSKWDTRNMTRTSGMFNGCKALILVDMTGWDTSKVTKMGYMFSGCSDLKTIIVSHKWNTRAVTESKDMFRNCTSIVGGAGTVYHCKHTYIHYARIDKGESQPGYLTSYLPSKPSIEIKPVFGGRTVRLDCYNDEAEIYYSFGSSNITTSCDHIRSGQTIFIDEPLEGKKAAMYFKAYRNGRWSELGKWGVHNVRIDQPQIARSGSASSNTFRIYNQTKGSYIVYTLDGSYPTIYEGTNEIRIKNGTLIRSTSGVITVPKGRTVRAIAIRCGLVTSEATTYKN